jgi:acyl carrier protein
VGYQDEDGYLFITGRIKEIINRGGEKIHPGEVDQVLMAHTAVAQAVACAVPDTRLGEEIIAVVVRRPGSTVGERELREFASTRLAAFKIPRRVIFVDQIPKGPTGKIQRIGLAAKVGIESLALTQPISSGAFVEPVSKMELAIARIWSEILEIDRVGLHDNFFELGGDSLGAVEVIARVEACLGVTINIRDLGFGTLQQLAAGCNERVASGTVREKSVFPPLKWVRKLLGTMKGRT